MNDDLELILKYNMTPMEAKAFKLALLWEEISHHEVPDQHTTRLKRKGDPRKSSLFKYAYKLATETNGLIPDEQYRMYIKAQINILQAITDGNVHARISPECLVGEKAWKRWRMWKARFDKIAIQKRPEVAHVSATFTKMKGEIDRTKAFLIQQFGKTPTQEDISRAVKERLMVKWITVSRVGPMYAILSPYLKNALGGKTVEDVFLFDLGIYRSSITPEVEEYFKKEFEHEYE